MAHRAVCRAVVSTVRWVLVFGCVASSSVLAQVVINEIHYEPDSVDAPEEFLELYNAGESAVDLSGWSFTDGILYTFAEGTRLEPGAFLVLAQDPASVETRYGVAAVGPYEGSLSNQGERLDLRSPADELMDRVEYRVAFPWPLASAGDGSSMELLHPELDNDLGASWRASGVFDGVPLQERRPWISTGDSAWRWRPATSEPGADWRTSDLIEDATWSDATTPIGFGPDGLGTVLEEMRNQYVGVYLRRSFEIADASELPKSLHVAAAIDDGAVVWLNGVEVLRWNAPDGELTFESAATRPWVASNVRKGPIPFPEELLQVGTNVLAVHAFNRNLTGNDFVIDVEMFEPTGLEDASVRPPTPGASNSVLTTNPSPQIRQVSHSPAQALPGEPVLISAKVSDADGVASVSVFYQVLAPGDFLPAFLPLSPSALNVAAADQELEPNPEFDAPERWVEVPLRDDASCGGVADDAVYSAFLPPQPSRTLVRYRIVATDGGAPAASVRAPFPDDGSLNFAYFVYAGVPPYEPTTATVSPEGLGNAYSSEVLTSLPVYSVLTRAEDWEQCIAWDRRAQIARERENARRFFNWECAFVYDDRVYDHVEYRLRGHNQRYQLQQKRSMRFRFHRGRLLRARDQQGGLYPEEWRILNTGKLYGPRNVGGFGVTEPMNTYLWDLLGVPAPFMHNFHLRVIDDREESPTGENGQYDGDFWGMFLAVEDYDVRFLRSHDVPKGNLYKLKDGELDGVEQRRYQADGSVSAAEDYDNVLENLHHTQTEEWLRTHVDYDLFNRYHTVVQAIRHYDHGVYPERESRVAPANTPAVKNATWYFLPSEETPLGKLWILPFDSDQSWGPNGAHQGWDLPSFSIIDPQTPTDYAGGPNVKPELYKEYRNVLREFDDLVWTEDALNPVIDRLADVVRDFVPADRDRWKDHPSGANTVTDFGPLEDRVEDMKVFAFTGGDHWPVQSRETSSVGAGGRAAELDFRASQGDDDTSIPQTPVVTYTGPEGFPADALSFATTAFGDPQGNDTFAALLWRLAEVTDPGAPAYDPDAEPLHEWDALWTSGELSEFAPSVTLPPEILLAGHAYRVRARVKDTSGRWSHWSAPVAFVAGGAGASPTGVIITEIFADAAGNDDGKEWFEVYNTTGSDINLAGWTIADNGEDSHIISGGDPVVVPAGGYLVLGESTDTEVNGGVAVDYAFGDDVTLGNSSDEIVLLAGGTVVHSVAYGEFTPAPLPIVSRVPSFALRGRSVGMALNYCTGPVRTWDQQTTVVSEDVVGTPGGANDGVDVCAVDNEPPTLVEARSPRRATVVCVFDEPLDPLSAQRAANYTLGGGVGSSASARLTGLETVELSFLHALVPGVEYELEVVGVADREGNTNGVSQALTVTFECEAVCAASLDCDQNGVRDDCDIATGALADCDGDFVPDVCSVADGRADDCNGNGLPDACDLAAGDLVDADANGIADACEGPLFLRSDCDTSGQVDGVTDVIFLLNYLFLGDSLAPACRVACDANSDARLNITDAIVSLDHSFRGGEAPPAPFPECGREPMTMEPGLGCVGATGCE